jgi:hypothetical protein
MPITLLIRPSEITEFTPLGGNIDVDKIKPVILDVQISVIEPLLGTPLYNRLLTDFTNNNLANDYLVLYEDYLKPILRHQIFAEYVEIASYSVDNGGIFKHQPSDSQIVDKSEVQYLAQTQRTKAQMYLARAQKFLIYKNIPEYLQYIDLDNKVDKIRLTGGWLMSGTRNQDIRRDRLDRRFYDERNY